MAYAAVASLSETTHLILKYHQDSISPQFKNQITYIQKHTIFLRSFLEDSPDEAHSWEERIRYVTNDAEDIIELLLSDSLLDSSEPKLKKGKYELSYDFDELERVTEEMESIVVGVRERHRENVGSTDDELMQIIDRLCGGPPGLQVIPIVGIGGIGKTTLARTAYDNPLIVEHFNIRGWVTVSQNYSWDRVVSGLLSSMGNLFGSVHGFLSGRRYLIVLDDVWSVEVLDKLESEIPRCLNGSRILVTTRFKDVATSVGFYIPIHQMCSMNLDQSWILLRHKIFERGHCPLKLEYMGKMIAASCRGVPLAIEVVSGILAADQTQAAWEDIAENLKTCIHYEDDEHILHILHLSYTHLPHHLRPCFLYLGMFAEDHQIRVSRLIKQWVAEGFLNESGCKSFEETGEEYLEALVKRRLLSVTKRGKCDGRIKRVNIHDLVRDFCTRQAQVDSFYVHITKVLASSGALELQRRVSISNNDNIHKIVSASTVRTVICLEDNIQGIRQWLRYFRLLRILDFSECHNLLFKLIEFPNRVFEQFNLRYLAFVVDVSLDFKQQFCTIPKAISNLVNLQTLIICRPREHNRGCVKLPVEIWKMRQLRHIVVSSCELPCPKNKPTYVLENLQTLNEAVDLMCSRTLKKIPNLKKLCIFYTGCPNYRLHNLIYLEKLEILKIEMVWPLAIRPTKPPHFPPTLKKLSLSCLKLRWEDMKIVGSLPNLQVLKLRDQACVGKSWETSEGGFSQLQFLLIDESNLEHWITKSGHFPKLKCLVLHHCWCLRKIPDDIREIQTLELIEVDEVNTNLVGSAD